MRRCLLLIALVTASTFALAQAPSKTQLHFSELSGQEYTVPGMFIANQVDNQPATVPLAPLAGNAFGGGGIPAPSHDGPAFWIKVSAKDVGRLQ
jgi:hypothetical protein